MVSLESQNEKLVIIGAGEFAQIADEYFTHDSNFDVVAFSVEKDFLQTEILREKPVVLLEELSERYPPKDYKVFVAVTYTKLNRVRTRLYGLVKDMGYECATYISSHAFVWRNAQVGENCFIFENNVIQPFVVIGDNVIMWSGNHIGHRTVIEDNCYISSHVVISGFCRIKDSSFIGVNATLSDNLTIGKDCLIGAGAVILQNTERAKIYKAAPAEPAKVSSLRFYRIKE